MIEAQACPDYTLLGHAFVEYGRCPISIVCHSEAGERWGQDGRAATQYQTLASCGLTLAGVRQDGCGGVRV